MLAGIARAFVADLADINGIAEQRVETATVRDIFQRYCELGSVRLLKEDLDCARR